VSTSPKLRTRSPIRFSQDTWSLHGLESAVIGEIGNAREIAVDRHDAVAAFEKQPRVAPATARDVENVAAAGNEARKTNDPR
jgi:hypothetical protein